MMNFMVFIILKWLDGTFCVTYSYTHMANNGKITAFLQICRNGTITLYIVNSTNDLLIYYIFAY